jgi:hypothetical protein
MSNTPLGVGQVGLEGSGRFNSRDNDPVRIAVDLPDDLIAEIEAPAPDTSWSQLIADALTFAFDQADAQQTLTTDDEDAA